VRLLFLTIIVAALASIQLATAQDTSATSRDAVVVKQIEQLEEARSQAIPKGDAGPLRE
jgi:Tfp pilus assembly protein PilV